MIKRRCRWLGHNYPVIEIRPAKNAPWSRWGRWMEKVLGPCARCGNEPPKPKPFSPEDFEDEGGSIWDYV